MENKELMAFHSMNSIPAGTVLFERGDQVDGIGLLAKGKIEAKTDGTSLVLGSGIFLGAWDLHKGTHSFTYTVVEDAAIYYIKTEGTESIRDILEEKPEYRGILNTSFNYIILELNKHLKHVLREIDQLSDFISAKAKLCEEIAKKNEIDFDMESLASKVRSVKLEEYALSERTEYYLYSGTIPLDVQKKYFGASQFVSYYHYLEQCEVIASFIKACDCCGGALVKMFRYLVTGEDSLFHMFGELALELMELKKSSTLLENAVDEIIEQINSTETMLIEKMGYEVKLDRERMEQLYLALLSGDSGCSEDFSRPGVEYLHDSLQQILDYAPVHGVVKGEFMECVEKFQMLNNPFARDPELSGLRKKITTGFFEIYEAVFLKTMEDRELPLVIELFLNFGFVSEHLLEDEDLETLVMLNQKENKKEDKKSEGCRVYTMYQWLKEIYRGNKEPSKSEFELDYAEYLREEIKAGRIDKIEAETLLYDSRERVLFECRNMLQYADRVLNGGISTFVPILCSKGMYNKITNAFVTAQKVNDAVKCVEDVDYSLFHRERQGYFEKVGVTKVTLIERVLPDMILFPTYGKNCLMWQDITGRKRNSKGRFFLPILFERDLQQEMVRQLAYFRWEKCRTEMGNHWNDFRYPSLTSTYFDFLQFYKKNSELSQEKKAKIRAMLQQYNNRYREVFAKEYEEWITKESRGAMRLSKQVRTIFSTYCPFSKKTRKRLEAQVAYTEAAAKYNRLNRMARKNIETLIRCFERDGYPVPEEVQDTLKYLQG